MTELASLQYGGETIPYIVRRVDSRKTLDAIRFAEVRTAFESAFPHLGRLGAPRNSGV